MVQAGYFNDEFIHHFVSKCSRRSPLINIGYYVRATIIDFTLHTFLTDVSTQPAQIVSCGAGFDTNYFRLKSGTKLHPTVVYYEVDFPEVVERKSRIIGDTAVLSQAVGVPDDEPRDIELKARQYRLLACDLRQLDNLESVLRLAGVDFSLPTLFLSECAVTYMDEPSFQSWPADVKSLVPLLSLVIDIIMLCRSSSALIRWVSAKFDRAVFAMYEQVYPEDGFGIVMAKHFESINTPLFSLATFPDFDSQEERYKTRGWSSCVSRSAWDVFINITDSAERHRAYNLEPFDEMEELHLKCCHYALTIASKGFITSLLNIPSTSPPRISAEESEHIRWLLRKTDANIDINRFAHTTTRLSETDGYLVVGGFGHFSGKKHGRRKEVLLSDNGGVRVLDVSFTCEEHRPEVSLDAMHHTCTDLSGTDSAVLYGGRTWPGRPVNVWPVVLTLETIGSDPPPESSDNVAVRALAEVKAPASGGETPRSRYRHSAVCLVSAVDRTPKNYVVVFGGRTETFQVLGQLSFLLAI
uniref:tRNA wybutosine-synthesizing protein 4 n=1 Tax=Timema shepardi TaxID=629360 RepID=A0A7R9B5A1_TIMSH|nr:unnamed protein product [Timema shepardi]